MTSMIDARWAELAPGTVASLDQLAAMVIEFLTTAELPECVQWRDLTHAAVRRIAP